MKREGRQHGMVRTHCILPTSKANSEIGAPPTAGMFTRVPSKPTNHSKFTGKCRVPRCSACHLHPSSKSKAKSKGSSKLIRGDFSFMVLDGDEDEEEEEEVVYDDVDQGPRRSNMSTEIRVVDENVDWNEEDDIGFCDVGLLLAILDGEEGWSLIGEM